MDEITISGRTVEEAVEAGLEALGAERSEVEVEVVDEGVKGILGLLGTRLARVRLVRKGALRGETPPAGAPAPVSRPAPGEAAHPVERMRAAEPRERAMSEACLDRPRRPREARPARVSVEPSRPRTPVQYGEASVAQVERAVAFVEGVCRLLGVESEVGAGEVDGAVRLSVVGDQMGLLIGRRGQTLDALQYLTGLVANKGAKAPARFVVDVEGYRDRREATLRQLAMRTAEKVKSRGHRAVLEPMTPQERRVIHLALAGDPELVTYSEGEEPYRRVIIGLREDGGRPGDEEYEG
ncbi:MAG: RNA-binding cell elongation regulator Jag/EloR [Chitinophagales bacterium]